MEKSGFIPTIREQTRRALWEMKNVIHCVPDSLWEKEYCKAPLYQHIYHMLHSLDLWYINPQDEDFSQPGIHIKNLNNLDIPPQKPLTREELDTYRQAVEQKILEYLQTLRESELKERPKNCKYDRFTLIAAQLRHLCTHMGMLMGFMVADCGLWPRVLGLTDPFLEGDSPKYF